MEGGGVKKFENWGEVIYGWDGPLNELWMEKPGLIGSSHIT